MSNIPKKFRDAKTALLSVKSLTGKQEPLQVQVKILEVKMEFGRAHFLVTPSSGSGKQWVTENRLTIR